MRVLFIPWSQPTHYLQMVPLAWALRAAGHDVRVAGQPHVVGAVKQSGLTVATVGSDYDYLPEFLDITRQMAEHTRRNPAEGAALAAKAELPPEVLKRALTARFAPFVKTAEAMADGLVWLIAGWRPDLVVADPFAVVAPLAAGLAGSPLVHHLTGPAIMRQLGLFPGCGAKPELWSDDLCRLYRRHGVEVRTEYAAATVDPCPERLQYAGIPHRRPVRFVPYNGPGDIPDWLSAPAGRPRVCVTWGTTTSQLTGPEGFLVPQILKSLAGADLEIVATVAAADRDLVGAVGPNVRLVEQIPLHLLLPTCAAIVHQSGTGTMLTAASLGVPQVLVPGILDQVATAEQMVAAGAGVSLTAAGLDPDAVTDAVTAVLTDPAIRESAGLLRQEVLAQPTPADVARTLEDLVAKTA